MQLQLQGIIPALTTPFDTQGALAADRLRENIEAYNRAGFTGYLAAGSTGESVLLDRVEFEKVLAVVRETAMPGHVLIAGTGVDSTAETISRTQFAANLGYHFALVCTPYFFKPMMGNSVLAEHYRRVADASKIPILLYSVPQFTGIAIDADLVAMVADHPNVAGMKDSSGNVDRVGGILASVPESFQLMTGAATTVYPSMQLGAKGGILALANFLPELSVALYNAITAQNSRESLDLQRRMLQASNRIAGTLGIPGVKYAMDCRGYYGGLARRPLLPLSDAQKRLVQSILNATMPAAAAT
jgi:4-hydroxy-2-oxoglutarate aldolase